MGRGRTEPFGESDGKLCPKKKASWSCIFGALRIAISPPVPPNGVCSSCGLPGLVFRGCNHSKADRNSSVLPPHILAWLSQAGLLSFFSQRVAFVLPQSWEQATRPVAPDELKEVYAPAHKNHIHCETLLHLALLAVFR